MDVFLCGAHFLHHLLGLKNTSRWAAKVSEPLRGADSVKLERSCL